MPEYIFTLPDCVDDFGLEPDTFDVSMHFDRPPILDEFVAIVADLPREAEARIRIVNRDGLDPFYVCSFKAGDGIEGHLYGPHIKPADVADALPPDPLEARTAILHPVNDDEGTA